MNKKTKLSLKAKKQLYKIEHRYRAVAREYIDNGFIIGEAYQKVYKTKKKQTAASQGSRMLRNLNFINILCVELEKVGSNINADYIKHKLIDITEQAKTKNATKLKAYDLLSKVSGLYNDDAKVQVNIYQGLERQTDEIIQDIQATDTTI